MKHDSLNRFDGLDKWAFTAIMFLAVWFCWLVLTLNTTAARSTRAIATQMVSSGQSPEYTAGLKTAKQLLYAGNMSKLKTLLDELAVRYPYQAEPYMFMADYHIRLQEPIAAMHAFRQALDLNIDYLERKSTLYQGKKIKNIVREAEEQIKQALAAGGANPLMMENRKELYYMLRKLAGGCSD